MYRKAAIAATGDTDSTYSTVANKTVSDIAGNKYKVTGSCSGVGTSGQATTTFEITLYKDGTYNANNLQKKLSAKGSFSFGNGATYSGTRQSTLKTGGSGSFSAQYSGFAYNVKNSAGEHGFSCNGASYTGYSSNP